MNKGHYKIGWPTYLVTCLTRATRFSMCGINSFILRERRYLSVITLVDGLQYNRYSADCKHTLWTYTPATRTCLWLTQCGEDFHIFVYSIPLFFSGFLHLSSMTLWEE